MRRSYMIQRDGGPPKRHSTPVGVVWVGSPGETRQNLPALGVMETACRTDERARVAQSRMLDLCDKILSLQIPGVARTRAPTSQ